MGPIALCRIPLPLPPDDDEEGSADMSSAAAGAAPDAAAAAGAAGQPLAAAGASTGPTCFYFAGRGALLLTLLLPPAPLAGCCRLQRRWLGPLPSSASSAHLRLPPFPAGCHLEPFAEGADMRLQEITYLLRTLPPRCHLVLTGDTNMRAAENASGK